MSWDLFIWFGSAAVLAAAAGASFSAAGRRNMAVLLTSVGTGALLAFIVGLWISLDRPPLRTMGETRLWYSFFALLSGLFTYIRWKYRWILPFSAVLSTVFIVINVLKPEIHDQTLMPALQSIWFIPHVTVYMFSYSLLGCAFLLATAGLFTSDADKVKKWLCATDSLVYIGVAFLTFGMLSGAIWAKDAWGHYWSWDPKETWALVTWLVYILYMHLRLMGKGSCKTLCLIIVFAFLCLQMCWWGVNYLPAAQDSIHVYNK